MTATDLDNFLSRHSRISRNTAQWRKGIELEITGYLCSEAPPADLVSSVRAIVFKEDRVLVMRNLDGIYILPGGRVEDGETHRETLQRELLEEAGAEIRAIVQFGLIHLKHTTPKPKGHPYPYPDFLWPVYLASFVKSRPEARVEDGYDISSEFMPLQDVRGLALDDHDRVFLEEAVRIAADMAC
jgi:8-oxo-dGTP pyrophosphatase MutT (NUDIX family)